MNSDTNLINVSYMRGQEKTSMGRLALIDRKIFFEYHPDFLKTELELSPLRLPLKSGVIPCQDRLFGGLFGVFNDSLPDGWGRLLLDRKLMSLGINPSILTPLDRLRYVGHNGMGALVYEPEITGSPQNAHEDFDEIENEIFDFQTKDNDKFVDDLLALNGSSAGARPKILTKVDNEDWIIKFRSFHDPKDVGPVEYAYHLMAKAAQLNIPEAKLFPSKNGPGYFGVKRFDRSKEDRLHMHTISGLLHVDHTTPSLDYETIMKATLWLTKDDRESEKLLRVAVFNVLTHNRDDHAKNFSFLMDSNGLWRASPSYDITYSSGPAGEHCTTIMGEGKDPNRLHLMKLAQAAGIKTQTALEIIAEVRIAVSNWEHFAQEASVSNSSTKRIKEDMTRIDQIFATIGE